MSYFLRMADITSSTSRQGSEEVPPEIFAAFRSNIEARARYADRLGVQYVHAIFPDKQVILREKFTVQNAIYLGERHLEASPGIAAHIPFTLWIFYVMTMAQYL